MPVISLRTGVSCGSALMLLACGIPLSAQPAPPVSPPVVAAAADTPTAQQPPLDLAEALRLARRDGPLRRVADAREQMGLGRVRETGQWGNPTLEWRRENLGSALQPDIFATLYVPFDVSGRRLTLRRAANAGRDRVNADAVAERREGELEVARAWTRAAVARGAAAIAQQQFEALQEIARVDRERLKEGLVSEAIGLRTSLEADRARVALVTANQDAMQSRGQLLRLLGLADSVTLEVAPVTAPPLPDAPDSAAVRDLALRMRPDVQAREAGVLEAQRRLSAEQRGVLGDVQLQGGTKETSGFMTGQVGVAMPLPLFNRNTGARQRATGELQEARALRDDIRLTVRTAVASSWRHYQLVRATATDAATFDARGREVARIARVAYLEGHATLTELLDAERAAADARHTQLTWAANAWLARLEFERALGARLASDSPLDLPVLSTLPTPGR